MKPQTQTTKHTPTPWTDSGHDGKTKLIIESKWGEVCRCDPANAEFICKAVNEHDTLIAQRNALLETLLSIELLAKEIQRSHAANIIASKAHDAIALCEPKEKEVRV